MLQRRSKLWGGIFLEYGTPLMSVLLFNYLGQNLSSSDDYWPEVEYNLLRERAKWGLLVKFWGGREWIGEWRGDFGGVITQGFLEHLLFNSSCNDFEKVEEGRKMRSQLWVRMAGYRNYVTYAGRKLNNKLRMEGYRKYISYRYVFISSFVSLTKYAGQNLNTLVWLRMAGEFISTSLFVYYFSSELWLRMAGYQNYLSSIYVFISSFVSLTKYAGQNLNTLMWLRMAEEFISTYFSRRVHFKTSRT